ncbi:hypothetical protein CP02DC21_1004A, partial [Chlamydia psittaci 02DC21]
MMCRREVTPPPP